MGGRERFSGNTEKVWKSHVNRPKKEKCGGTNSGTNSEISCAAYVKWCKTEKNILHQF